MDTNLQTRESLPRVWLRTAKEKGNQVGLMDSGTASLSYAKLLTATLAFSQRLNPILQNQQNIGILLPPTAGGVIANFAALILGKTVVNLNYTSSLEIVKSCMKRAEIRTVLSSQRFFEKLEARGMDLSPLREQVDILYLEDVKNEISKARLAFTMFQVKLFPLSLLHSLYCKETKADDVAVILFSSGSEGMPKGIQLTHFNILSNVKQAHYLLDPQDDDVMLSSLPLFHAFGLTVTTFLPLLAGIPMVCQPDPTDAKVVGNLISQHNVSILCGTSTFLRMYTRHPKVLPEMFESLRLVIAGAERVHAEVRHGFKEKFQKEIYEGYGATEMSPVISCNLPHSRLRSLTAKEGQKIGSVGMPLPETLVKIVNPETLEDLPVGEAGLILITGPQLMKGYLNDEAKTQEVLIEKAGRRWYKSGDKGKIDEDGFVTIIDRYSRFAKLGGEMISLTAIEEQISQIIHESDVEITATSIPDSSKGEKIVLLIAGNMEIETIQEHIFQSGMNPLTKPKQYLKVEEIPKLGSGKKDFAGIKSLAIGLLEKARLPE
ncbi:MAG: AMP-binding protein [SAR324 cluster bacterium]|nr:AMP-binding protein [SAR324 cluster bacterium]